MELSNDNIYTDETVLANFVMDTLRRKLGAHLPLSTTSSFRYTVWAGDTLSSIAAKVYGVSAR